MNDRRIAVIGLGSPLMGDDGLGLAALERLRARPLPAEVTLVDGGTWGLNLLPVIESYPRVLLLDAIHAGGAPGELYHLDGSQIPAYLTTKLSPHQIDLREVLALATLRGTVPAELVAIGLEPELVELQAGLGPMVTTRLNDLVGAALAQLAAWGVETGPGALAHA